MSQSEMVLGRMGVEFFLRMVTFGAGAALESLLFLDGLRRCRRRPSTFVARRFPTSVCDLFRRVRLLLLLLLFNRRPSRAFSRRPNFERGLSPRRRPRRRSTLSRRFSLLKE